MKKLKGHTSWVKCLQFDKDVLVTGSYDSTIKEWSRTNDSYDLIKEYKGHGKYLSEESVHDATVVSISIPPPSFKPVPLSLSRSSLSKTPKQVIF